MSKNILVITQYFYPENFRINDMCKELILRGYKVTVLTGVPNYPEGKFYKGYGILKKRKESWEGIDIIRIPLISRGQSKIRLVLNYYSFVISGFFWNIFTKLKADYVFTYQVSPLMQAKIGVWYSKKNKVPNYLYVQDLWPDTLQVMTGIKNKMILSHYDRMAKKIYKNCNNIFATSKSFVTEIQNRLVENIDKVIYLPQYAEEYYKPCADKVKEISDINKLKIVFTGNIGYAQGLDILPKIASRLKNGKITDICFVIVGDGRYKKTLVEEIENMELSTYFMFINRVPSEEIPKILSSCDLAFISFQSNSLFEKTIPAKLQSYLACGIPILGIVNGETRKIILDAECGIVCDKNNVVETVEKILKLKKDGKEKLLQYSQNAIKYCELNFKKGKIFADFEQYFKK